MRKLRKKHVRFENSVEAYLCNCGPCLCNCTCNPQSGVLEFHVGSNNAFVNRRNVISNAIR